MSLKLKINKKNITGNILDVVTALFLVLNCQSIWQNTVDKNYHIYEFCLLFIILNTLYTYFHWKKKRGINLEIVKISLLYYFLISLVTVFSVSQENLVRFLARFIVLPFFLLHFSSEAPVKKKMGIFIWFVNWVSIIAWISIIFWGLSTLGIIKETGTVNVDWFGIYRSYYGVYFSSIYQYIDWINIGLIRNIGVFTEGPMYMFVLVLALLFKKITKQFYSYGKWQTIGIIIALITVASVTGYICLLLIYFIEFFYKFKDRRKQICFAFGGFIFVLFGIYWLISVKQDTASYIARIDDYVTGIKVWVKHPVFGNGYENIDLLKSYMSQTRSWNQGFSNTIFSILAYGGVVLFSAFIYPIFRGIYYGFKKSDYTILSLSVVYLFLYFTVIFYTFYINFAVWGLLICVYKFPLFCTDDSGLLSKRI
ncbi:O-antigen ligase family protein [Enterococcus cecorum]|nr:O-antigen ligase family protein [Enterococcus cecorum]